MAVKSSSMQAMALALAGAILVPNEAEACSPDYCSYVEAWSSLEVLHASIPTDGVLLLQGVRHGDLAEEDWLDKVDLTVTRDGQPIAGAVEAAGVRDVLLWRPAEPLEPGDYKVVGSVDNPDDLPYEYCGPDLLEFDLGFQVEAGSSAPLSSPEATITETLIVGASEDLEDFVCCDGAMPYSYSFDCGGSGTYVEWSEGFCAARRGFGSLQVQATVAVELPPSTAAMVVRELLVEGQPFRPGFYDSLTVQSSEPICVAVQLRNLATGETALSQETCHGADVVAQLGDHAIDPAPALAAECAEGAYTCALTEDGWQWDAAHCTPWPAEGETTGDPTGGPTTGGPDSDSSDSASSDGSDGSDGSESSEGPASGGQDGLVDHGCACDSRAPSPLGALMLLGLGLLRPRRRRRYAVPKDMS
ncbi:MYXO-CTERM sorting domain-containing protein [Nannocystis punicea]|uniref:MYXO-CTERM sorting domain-containing protein n=1 Tax=Nannocystis punicea TaxID=2995304 RepID=A0ABY7HIG1_9BACT|nr:MYXO-CTERM sorting domain-containing protein [Nannocystis poenicansa]WAS98883.1 MYXO-CTERM sorting domain-containing protein [Nannocystis poenicansa]